MVPRVMALRDAEGRGSEGRGIEGRGAEGNEPGSERQVLCGLTGGTCEG